MNFARSFVLLFALAGLQGCYYWQAARGHMELMDARRPVNEVLADPATPAEVRSSLTVADEALRFAHDQLALPDNGSYRHYADLGRDAVVWNVFAAPELSLEPEQWCFPVAGCVAYRGYFSEEAAREFAAGLEEEAFDVMVGAVGAYSTLGRFADPILNTMVDDGQLTLVAVLFHELAHQRYYLPGDSAFNESYASFVEQEGMRRWLRDREAVLENWLAAQQRRRQALCDLDALRGRLDTVYSSQSDDEQKRADKAQAFEAFRVSQQNAVYPGWGERLLNNADLIPFQVYDQWVPAFAQLFAEQGSDMKRFHEAVEALGEADDEAREARLIALAGPARSCTDQAIPSVR